MKFIHYHYKGNFYTAVKDWDNGRIEKSLKRLGSDYYRVEEIEPVYKSKIFWINVFLVSVVILLCYLHSIK